MKDIIVKDKTYKLSDDVEYGYIKKFRDITRKYNTYDNPDEVILKALMEAICPAILADISFEEMTICGTKLMFREVKKLIIDLRTSLDDFINEELEGLSEYIKAKEDTPKNPKEAM
jgi:hypothetical protein